jgi:hypothetical protein
MALRWAQALLTEIVRAATDLPEEIVADAVVAPAAAVDEIVDAVGAVDVPVAADVIADAVAPAAAGTKNF